jgi:hypothetical protein
MIPRLYSISSEIGGRTGKLLLEDEDARHFDISIVLF